VLFTNEAHFVRDSNINIYKLHQRTNPYGLIHSRLQQQFSINVCSEFGGDYFVGPHILKLRLTATTTKISSYMIYQSYWNMYNWQSDHECGTCIIVLRHILTVMCETFSTTLSRLMER
jgi:hypothetical protein